MSSQVADPAQLLQSLVDGGTLSPAAFQALNAGNVSAQLQNVLGVPAIDVEATEIVLVTLMPDDSSSIRSEGNTQLVRDGHNQVVDALLGSKQADSVMFCTRYLNGEVINPYRLVSGAVKLDAANYDPRLGTPLYDQTMVLLAGVLAKLREFQDSGCDGRTVTFIITDGADQHSRTSTAADVAKVVRDMLRTEQHIIGAIGIDDHGQTDFKRVFQEMGIPDEWILTPKSTPSDIRRAFAVASKSAVRASQAGGTSFSQVALGGFGNP